MLDSVILLIVGIFLLAVGAGSLVRGATLLATALRMPSLFIGLTVVAYGTSTPEMVVSTLAAARDLYGVAVGNVVGSNIFNTGVILGLAALLRPLRIHDALVRREVPLVAVVTVLLGALAVGGRIDSHEGALLLAVLAAYTWWSYRETMRARLAASTAGAVGEEAAPPSVKDPLPAAPHGFAGWRAGLVFTTGGLGLLILSAHWVVNGAVDIARFAGVSETIIGLTIVAAGTSLPELATSVVAALRGESDIAVGNVLGSNIFNILGILGLAGLLKPLTVPPEILTIDIPVALFFAIVSIPVAYFARRISRPSGAALLLLYLAYCTLLIARSQEV